MKEEHKISDQNNIDIVKILDIGNRYLHGEISLAEILKTYGPEYAELAKAYMLSFSTDALESKIRHFLSESKDEILRNLNEEGFSHLLTETSVKIASLTRSYMKKEIDLATFISRLGGTGVKDISDTLIKAYDIDITKIKEMAQNIAKENSVIVSYAAFTEAYKILMSVLEDAALQHEHRLMVEKECQRTIALIKEYREAMQESITRYFERHLKTFEYGFAQMDKAIEINDSTGYIRANAEIQEMLGYYAQFRNQEEFDELMDSDTNFKL